MAADRNGTRAPEVLGWAVGFWVSITVLQALFATSLFASLVYRTLTVLVTLGWCAALLLLPSRLREGRTDVRRWPLDARLRHEPLRHSWALPLAGAVVCAAWTIATRSPSLGLTAGALTVLAVTAPLTRRRVHEALLARGAVPEDPTTSAARHRRRRMRLLVALTWSLAIGLSLAATEIGRDDLGLAGVVGLTLAGLSMVGFVVLALMTLRGPDPVPLWYRESRERDT